MKKLCLPLTLLISLFSSGQYASVKDSLDNVPFIEMSANFMRIDSLNLSLLEKAVLQYEKIKLFIKANPKNNYSPQFITWGKYFDAPQLDTLYNLLDSSYKVNGQDFIKRLKIRSSLLPGTLFPSMSLTDTLNRQFAISGLRGKIVFIDIWASTCRPCREEMPQLIKLYEKYKDKGFTVISISLDDDKIKWLNAIQKDQQPWQQFGELTAWRNNWLFRNWGIDFMPYNFLIDKEGKLVDKEITPIILEKNLRLLIKE
jgi:thiol-disulfide isomerase/thioredoxin